MGVSSRDIKTKIEVIISDILSRKHDAKITVKFVDANEKNVNDNGNTSGDIRK